MITTIIYWGHTLIDPHVFKDIAYLEVVHNFRMMNRMKRNFLGRNSAVIE